MRATLLRADRIFARAPEGALRPTSLCVMTVVLLLGCSEPESHAPPVDASAMISQRLLATSEGHTCALRSAGLYCWGGNFAGQLGNIETRDSPTPVLAHFAGADIVQLALAVGRTCVRRGNGTVACWGANDKGQIGDGTRSNSYTPVDARGISDATQLAIDDSSTCVLRAGDAGVTCWGQSPTTAPEEGSLVPVPIAGLSSVVELRAGSGAYCAREAAGAVKCWFFDAGKWTAASEVSELSGARAIAMTNSYGVCALTPSSDIRCFVFEGSVTQTVVDSQGSVALAPTGGLAVCGLDSAQTWRCWPIVPRVDYTPLRVHSNINPVELVMMGLRVCALREDASVACLTQDDLTEVPTTDFPDLLPVELPL